MRKPSYEDVIIAASNQQNLDPAKCDFPVYRTGDGALAKLAAPDANTCVYMSKPTKTLGVNVGDCVHPNVSLRPANQAAIDLLLADKRRFMTDKYIKAAVGIDGRYYAIQAREGLIEIGDPIPEDWEGIAVTPEARQHVTGSAGRSTM